jgi:iron(III) transport system ATP-binding protein
MLRIESLVKTFPPGRGEKHGRVHAVDDIDLEVEEGELVTLLGPSGCGKTTTLRCIAGLEMPDSGEITVAGRVFFSSGGRVRVPANERGLGMVFQSYAIWPHMDVFHNVAFPLNVLPRRKRPSRSEIRNRVERVLAVVKLDHVAQRQATDLSGGQQQRLALARALVLEPPLLLLDEPLSNLDAKLREEMVFELKRLQRELNVTSIYVTHDQAEALAMSNRIAVMRDGKIHQVGRPRDVYEQPQSRFVADFIGTSNFIDAKISGRDGDTYEVETAGGRTRVPAAGDYAVGAAVILCVRPEHIDLSLRTNGSRPADWPGTVENRAFLGEVVDHVVAVGGRTIRVRCNASVSIAAGTDVAVHVRGEACSLLPAE